MCVQRLKFLLLGTTNFTTFFLLLSFSIIVPVGEAAAQQYRFIDAAGNIVFKSELDNVPLQYRQQARESVDYRDRHSDPYNRPTRSLFDGPTQVPLRSPRINRGGMRSVWRPRSGYSGLSASRVP